MEGELGTSPDVSEEIVEVGLVGGSGGRRERGSSWVETGVWSPVVFGGWLLLLLLVRRRFDGGIVLLVVVVFGVVVVAGGWDSSYLAVVVVASSGIEASSSAGLREDTGEPGKSAIVEVVLAAVESSRSRWKLKLKLFCSFFVILVTS